MANSDLLDINPDQDVIIISHPRSGSTWLQSCLPHVNCSEPFSKFVTVNFHNNDVTFNFGAFTDSADQATWLTRFGTASNWTLGSATTDAADGTFSVVPEPSAQALLGIGMAALVAVRAVRRSRGNS